MLLHLRPRFYSAYFPAELISFEVPELNVKLSGGIDLMTKQPYPNKSFRVGCRKKGKKAMSGLLIETTSKIRKFDVISEWAIDPVQKAVHVVHYEILDEEFEVASDYMALWYPHSEFMGGWQNRWPEGVSPPPTAHEPYMAYEPSEAGSVPAKDEIDWLTGCIGHREQSFSMPTIEKERLFTSPIGHGRIPSIEDAFQA